MGARSRAILWAQLRSLRNHLPRANRAGLVLSAVLMSLWYGGFVLLAISAGTFMANPAALDTLASVLPAALFGCLMYWQGMPLLMASMGSSLDIKKLLAYPIPHRELFRLEVLLRISTGAEVLIVLLGAGFGLLLNAKIPVWAPLSLAPFILFNLFLATAARELLKQVLSRKYVREIAALCLVLAAALPQVVLTTGRGRSFNRLFAGGSFVYSPWGATAQLLQGRLGAASLGILLAWTAAAYGLARWQFERGLRFDSDEHEAASGLGVRSQSLLERFYRLPGSLLADPIAAIVEKELRLLTRSSRFRLVFLMGFSFGLLIWVPVTFGRAGNPHSFVAQNYLTAVSIYALLLLSDVLFWNSLGFDRSAAQIYFLAPVKVSKILIGKNLAAIVFVVAEITAVVIVCLMIRLPVLPEKVVEAYLVPLVTALFIMSIGNLTSTYNPRPVDPAKSFRSNSGGRTQALLIPLFPLSIMPVSLAYLARYAFESYLAFYIVLLFAAALGGVVYSISLDSAVRAAEGRKELIIAALSRGEGPVSL